MSLDALEPGERKKHSEAFAGERHSEGLSFEQLALSEPLTMHDPLAAARAALADRYLIERELGRGGMATVYLGTEVKHHRLVAVKVLNVELAQAVGGERFLREIELTARLDHPHILPLLDSGEAGDLVYYAMPYVAGETLRQRLDREKQLPVEDALRIAQEMADALGYAHAHGIVHRDVKPENILLAAGHARLADLGIARALTAAGGDTLTATGVAVGTPAYMSPEQGSGERDVDARSDVYALGCVLYEMLAGQPPFVGPTHESIVRQHVTVPPPAVAVLRPTVAPAVDQLVARALAKTAADRFATGSEFADALAILPHAVPPAPAARPAAHAASWRRRALAGWSIAALLLLVAVWSWVRPRPTGTLPVVRSHIPLTAIRSELSWNPSLALSPDGAVLVYLGSAGGETQLFARPLDQLEARPIPGTADADLPFFSPDARWLGFVQHGTLRKVALAGGTPITIATNLGETSGASWGSNDTILIEHAAGGLFVVAAEPGSTLRQVGNDHGYSPHVLPGALHALVQTRWGEAADQEIRVVSLRTGEVRSLGVRGAVARYVAPGFIVYRSGPSSLAAVPFDAQRLEVTGPPISLSSNAGEASGSFAVGGGALVYLRSAAARGDRTAVWVTRTGQAETVDPDWRGDFRGLALSPDGTKLAVTVNQLREDVWVKHLSTGPFSRLTTEGTRNFRPAWTPDGQTVTYISNRSGARMEAWVQRSDASRPPELLLAKDPGIFEAVWSPDRTWLLFRVDGVGRAREDLWAIRPGLDSMARALFVTPRAQEWNATFSPDGRWIAYTSDESGRAEVYMVPFPNVSDRRVQVSTNGGTEPIWARDAPEIFYRDGTDSMVVANVTTNPTVGVTGRRVLFDASRYLAGLFGRAYDVSPDGQRFVMIQTGGQAATREVILVQNLIDDLNSRVKDGRAGQRRSR